MPATMGSGGGAGVFGSPGAGGGVIRLIVGGELLVDGRIEADGWPSTGGAAGSGAGGSLWIDAASLAGAGQITASGGDSPGNGGGGGGGRVAVFACAPIVGVTLDVGGGTTSGSPPGYTPGSLGTAFVQTTGAYVSSSPQPQHVCAGDIATFSVTVGGSPPYSYQWRKNSIDIAGATSDTLAIVDVTSADTGSYDCVVSNFCYTVTSASAMLSVDVIPGDFNEDGVVDSDDFTLELPCFAGPGVPNTGCAAALFGLADFDDDDDIDMHDFAEFQRLVGSVCP